MAHVLQVYQTRIYNSNMHSCKTKVHDILTKRHGLFNKCFIWTMADMIHNAITTALFRNKKTAATLAHIKETNVLLLWGLILIAENSI